MGFSPSKAEGVKHLLGNLKCMQKTNTNKRNFSLSSSTILAIRIYWLQLLQFGVVLKYEPFSQPLVLLGMFSFLYTHFRYSLGRNSNCFISLPALHNWSGYKPIQSIALVRTGLWPCKWATSPFTFFSMALVLDWRSYLMVRSRH